MNIIYNMYLCLCCAKCPNYIVRNKFSTGTINNMFSLSSMSVPFFHGGYYKVSDSLLDFIELYVKQ